jgi:hypothetical protein
MPRADGEQGYTSIGVASSSLQDPLIEGEKRVEKGGGCKGSHLVDITISGNN